MSLEEEYKGKTSLAEKRGLRFGFEFNFAKYCKMCDRSGQNHGWLTEIYVSLLDLSRGKWEQMNKP